MCTWNEKEISKVTVIFWENHLEINNSFSKSGIHLSQIIGKLKENLLICTKILKYSLWFSIYYARLISKSSAFIFSILIRIECIYSYSHKKLYCAIPYYISYSRDNLRGMWQYTKRLKIRYEIKYSIPY